jgi:hypothetical protein
MALSAELMLKLRLAARCDYIALRGSRDVLVLALAGTDWLHHDHQPHQRVARGQAVPRLVGSHGRQSNFRRTVGVALLVSTYRRVSGDEGKAVGTVSLFDYLVREGPAQFLSALQLL